MSPLLKSRESIKVLTDTGFLHLVFMEEVENEGAGTFLYCVLEDKNGKVVSRFEVRASEIERMIPLFARISEIS